MASKGIASPSHTLGKMEELQRRCRALQQSHGPFDQQLQESRKYASHLDTIEALRIEVRKEREARVEVEQRYQREKEKWREKLQRAKEAYDEVKKAYRVLHQHHYHHSNKHCSGAMDLSAKKYSTTSVVDEDRPSCGSKDEASEAVSLRSRKASEKCQRTSMDFKKCDGDWPLSASDLSRPSLGEIEPTYDTTRNAPKCGEDRRSSPTRKRSLDSYKSQTECCDLDQKQLWKRSQSASACINTLPLARQLLSDSHAAHARVNTNCEAFSDNKSPKKSKTLKRGWKKVSRKSQNDDDNDFDVIRPRNRASHCQPLKSPDLQNLDLRREKQPVHCAATSFKHREIVRNRRDREQLHGFDCNECRRFYEIIGRSGSFHLYHTCADNSSDAHPQHPDTQSKSSVPQQQFISTVSRHRFKYEPPLTPQGFWNIPFSPSPQKTKADAMTNHHKTG